jgi:hypothetical protein
MNELVSDSVFRVIITAATGGFSAIWVVHDLLFLSRLRGKDMSDPLIRDQRFGYVMGVIMGLIGVFGMLRYNGVV